MLAILILLNKKKKIRIKRGRLSLYLNNLLSSLIPAASLFYLYFKDKNKERGTEGTRKITKLDSMLDLALRMVEKLS